MRENVVVLGGGCFWCIEAIFSKIKGIQKVLSGYSGGAIRNPTYEDVCSGKTGHAEVVRIEFDSSVISYEYILELFWHIHDPTTLNRQGNDVGEQYRSVVFYFDEAQRVKIESIKQKIDMSDLWPNPIVTSIEPMKVFYEAEAYHQDYFSINSTQPYCSLVIAPKVAMFMKKYKHLLKDN